MLIKAGLTVAAAAAGLLAVAPLAFAGDSDHGHDHGHHGHHWGNGHDGDDHDGNDDGNDDSNGGSCKQSNSARDERDGGGGGGLLNISDINAQVPVQACNNSILEGVLGILSSGQRNDDRH